jgi:hypothetical protein
VLTFFLFVARALISGAFQAAYVYTPEVSHVLIVTKCAFNLLKLLNFLLLDLPIVVL